MISTCFIHLQKHRDLVQYFSSKFMVLILPNPSSPTPSSLPLLPKKMHAWSCVYTFFSLSCISPSGIHSRFSGQCTSPQTTKSATWFEKQQGAWQPWTIIEASTFPHVENMPFATACELDTGDRQWGQPWNMPENWPISERKRRKNSRHGPPWSTAGSPMNRTFRHFLASKLDRWNARIPSWNTSERLTFIHWHTSSSWSMTRFICNLSACLSVSDDGLSSLHVKTTKAVTQ